jgi:diacylglycerol kinase (ATP)
MTDSSRSVFVVINYGDRPHSTPRTIERIRQILESHQLRFHIALSRSIEHSRELVAQAALEEYNTLVIGGGDGTVHSLLNLAVDKNVTLGILPLGTVNALARSIGIPMNPLEAAEIIARGEERRIDMGKVNDRSFLCFSSVGYDASVCHTVSPELKLRIRNLSYVIIGIHQLTRLRHLPRFTVTIEASADPKGALPEIHEGYSLILSNIRLYAGFPIFDLDVQSGYMELYIFKSNLLRDYFRYVLGFALSRKALQKVWKDVYHARVTRFSVACDKPMFLQADGEPVTVGDNRRYDFQVIPGGIRMLFPK